ncbi:MAG: ribokinase [Chloroflexi bacterium]|nr:ribokinase [Chloroflexota bacterium]
MSSSPSTDTIDLLVIGHVTEDYLDGRAVLGGTATYASLAAHRLGARVAVLTSAGWEPGLVDLLRGIRVARLAAGATTRFQNHYQDGRRVQHIQALAEPLAFTHLLPEWRRAPMVLIAPVAHELEPELVSCFPSALLGVTPQGWMRGWDRQGRVRPIPWEEGAEPVLQRADATIFSEEDVAEPGQVERYAAQARLLVVTLGRRGARVYHQGHTYHSPAFKPEREVDPTGAGDAFAATFLLRLHETQDPNASADYANCVASFVVEQPGPAGIPTRDQVEARWQAGARLEP